MIDFVVWQDLAVKHANHWNITIDIHDPATALILHTHYSAGRSPARAALDLIDRWETAHNR